MAKLAEGGYQFGELAKLQYPGGIDLTDKPQDEQVAMTRELLKQDSLTIFEAAFATDMLFVRVDLLCKQGNRIELIEVKAKSFDPEADSVFKCKRGGFRKGLLPYLQDIAFQKHVAQLAYPALLFSCSLLFANKAAPATVDGLNQMFPVVVDPSRGIRVKPNVAVTSVSVGAPPLVKVPVDVHADEIIGSSVDLGASGTPIFPEAVTLLAKAYREDRRLPEKIGSSCRNCQFKTENLPTSEGQRSGFHECWRAAAGFKDEDFAQPLTLQLWNSRRINRLLDEGKYKQSQLTADDVGFDGTTPGADGIKLAQLHWYQASRKWPGSGDFYLHHGMREAMTSWRFPLHFIDFETATVALPFHKGSKPYETVAFQFSHHVLDQDGTVRHQTQFLQTTPGINPNVQFLRALKAALGNDEGTVLRWAAHENTVLNHIINTVLTHGNELPDARDLVAFAMTLTESAEEDATRVGTRSMVDLCQLSQKFFFHPSTEGSPSLKKVLPALMKSSQALRDTYSRPIYGGTTGIPSLNFKEPVAWWQEKDGTVCDPYKLLPPVTSAPLSPDSVLSTLRDGGAAMTAYVRLQFESICPVERRLVESALLRYCELDTLAMVMAVQAWTAWLRKH